MEEDILKMDPIDFHSIFSPHTMEINVYGQLFDHTFFKISSFVFNRRKKLMQVWNN